MKRTIRGHDEMSVIERRIGYLIGARLREADKIRAAMRKQDEIREKHPALEGWGASITRKWREAR